MSAVNYSYATILDHVMTEGFWYTDPRRKGVQRIQVPEYKFEHNLQESFPAIATKKLAWKSVTSELLWFLNGHQNIAYLHEHNNHIWDKDAYAHYVRRIKSAHASPNIATMDKFLELVKQNTGSKAIPGYSYGDLGPVYGYLWRNWPYGDGPVYDQIMVTIREMVNNPMSTEHIVTSWHPSLKEDQALPPCHYSWQILMRPLSLGERDSIFKRNNAGKLMHAKVYDHTDFDKIKIPKYGFTLEWDQRSVDVFLGLPFNIASYALLAHILGKITNSVPLKLVGNLRNVHLYDNSITAAKTQLSREPNKHSAAKLLMKDEFHYMCDDRYLHPELNANEIIKELRPDMFKLYNYYPDDPIKVEMLERNT